jgi:hypothetical protein
VALFRLHQLAKFIEEITRIVWTGASFWVILHAECAGTSHCHAFVRKVIQIGMRDVGNSA